VHKIRAKSKENSRRYNQQYNTNLIYNARKVTPKCEYEARQPQGEEPINFPIT